MTSRTRWILELDPPLPGPTRVAPHVVDPVVLPRMQSGLEGSNWGLYGADVEAFVAAMEAEALER